MDLADRPIPPAALLALDPRPIDPDLAVARRGRELQRLRPRSTRRLVEEGYAAGATVDVEHARGLLSDRRRFPNRDRVIVSLHSPFSLPADWDAKVSAMRAGRGARP